MYVNQGVIVINNFFIFIFFIYEFYYSQFIYKTEIKKNHVHYALILDIGVKWSITKMFAQHKTKKYLDIYPRHSDNA